jgi:hypothetical protein
MCLNEILVGQMYHGSIACSVCKIGFDDPEELFIRLFHRHTQLCAVNAKTIEVRPLRVADMLDELLATLRRVCMDNTITTLVNRGIYQLDAVAKRCTECDCDLESEDGAWRDAVAVHLVIKF